MREGFDKMEKLTTQVHHFYSVVNISESLTAALDDHAGCVRHCYGAVRFIDT